MTYSTRKDVLGDIGRRQRNFRQFCRQSRTGFGPCPASPSCSWTGGFNAGDTLVWAFDNTANAGSGPLTLGLHWWYPPVVSKSRTMPQPVSLHRSRRTRAGRKSVWRACPSDAAGDPIFIGAQDTVAEITSLVFSLTACTGGCDGNDFAVNTLKTINSVTVPAPSISALAFRPFWWSAACCLASGCGGGVSLMGIQPALQK